MDAAIDLAAPPPPQKKKKKKKRKRKGSILFGSDVKSIKDTFATSASLDLNRIVACNKIEATSKVF